MRHSLTEDSLPNQELPVAEAASEIGFLKAVADGEARAIAAMTLRRRLDFASLADFLIKERMGIYIHTRLSELGLLALLPPRVAKPIRWQHAEQRQRNGGLLALLDEVQEAFAEAGFEVLVLKGLPLSERFWGGIDRRFSLDLDLMVPRDHFRRAARVLLERGFAAPDGVPQPAALALGLSHALELTRDGLSLDLHWTLRNRPGLSFDLDGIARRAQTCRIAGLACRIPSDEDQLVMVLTSLANDIERGHHRLRAFWDIYLMLQAMQGVDWRTFWRSRADQGLSDLLLNMLALVLARLDCADELPAVAAAISADADRLVICAPDEMRRLLGNAPQSLANRRWLARLLPMPAWRYWAWWGSTVPLRFLLGRHI
jgi:hypothetical protein